ncbi:MAG TPA: M13 family metallopeptidase [Vicinamibacteria bacterium]|nr:M13 family metallopeptidase [Vicinamibacteria bacterium]
MRLLTAAALLALVPCALAAAAPALHGIQTGDLDRAVSPCGDFFEFANGGWRAANPIPASMLRWSRRWQAGESTKEQLKVILDEVSARGSWPRGSVEQLIGDHYGACMDEPRANQLGVEPVRPPLEEIANLPDIAGVIRMIGRFHELAIPVPFGVAATPDSHQPSQVIADVYAAGLGLPDRDYYVRPEPRFQEAREKYRSHVMRMLELAGEIRKDARRDAEAVLELEAKLAQAQLDKVALRDPKRTDHRTTFVQLTNLASMFDWPAYFAAARLPRAALNVQQPEFLRAFDRLLQEEPLAAWKAYLRWHLLHSAAAYLSVPVVEEDFGFFGRYLGGAAEMKPRWKRCAESTDALLGEALGRKYVERHFPPSAKARVQEMVKNLLLAMGDTIRGLDWMGPLTKEKALEKLATFNPKIGYPDKWKDYSSIVVRRDALWANVVAERTFNVREERARIGQPVDRGRWGLTPPTSDAYYDPLLNEIVFPAGILQPPAFDLDATDAVNYGAIGVVIGHEISHGFDDEGAQYDARGRLANWWTADDLKRFQERGQCVVDQFEGYLIEPGIHHNGRLVLGESIGDLAGAKLAYRAFQRSLAGRPTPPAIDGFSAEQQFFIAWGQFRGDAIRPEAQRLMVQTDPHPVARFRVIGPLANLPEFQEAFACPDDAPMVRPPAQRCEVW